MYPPPLARVLSMIALATAPLPAVAQGDTAANAAPISHMVIGRAIPPGAKIQAVLDGTLSADVSHPGDRFTASVLTPYYDSRGESIIPPGAHLVGRVVSIEPARDSSAAPQITVAIEGLEVRESVVPIAASIIRMRTTLSRTWDREPPQPRVAAGATIEVELTQPVSVMALRHAETERAFGGGPRP